jgi:hypothetical protein
LEGLSNLWTYLLDSGIVSESSLNFDGKSLWAGLLVGIIWGFVLHKTSIPKYDTVARLFMLQEFTLFRVGTPLFYTAMPLLFFFQDVGVIGPLSETVPNTMLLGNMMGGIFMGMGIAICGYCPGTGVAALGEGAIDALFFMLGMLVGSFFFAEIAPWAKRSFLDVGNLGKITIHQVLHVNHWFVIVFMVMMLVAFDVGITVFDWLMYSLALPAFFFRRFMKLFDDFVRAIKVDMTERKIKIFSVKTLELIANFFKDPSKALRHYRWEVAEMFSDFAKELRKKDD